MDEATVEAKLTSLPQVSKNYPFEKGIAIYSYKTTMFALLEEGTKPVRLTLRCDATLAKLLREKYETVMSADKLDKQVWNSLVLSGQLPDDEVDGLIRHAWEIAKQVQPSAKT